MMPAVINIADKLAAFADHFNPRIIGRYNDNELRVAKVLGAFTWHHHADSDEIFMVISGELDVEFRNGKQRLHPGEMIVVPAGIEHRTVADSECHILIINRAGEPNTGVNPSELTRKVLEEI